MCMHIYIVFLFVFDYFYQWILPLSFIPSFLLLPLLWKALHGPKYQTVTLRNLQKVLITIPNLHGEGFVHNGYTSVILHPEILHPTGCPEEGTLTLIPGNIFLNRLPPEENGKVECSNVGRGLRFTVTEEEPAGRRS